MSEGQVKSAPTGARFMDRIGASISSLCLIHCIVLPFAVTFAPAVASLAEAEWVHKVLVVLAAPSVVALFAGEWRKGGSAAILTGAALGFILLLASAFFEPLEDYEKHLTVAGAFLLGGAHIFRLRRKWSKVD